MSVDSNVATLHKQLITEMNQYLSMVLHYITQPNYMAAYAIQAHITELATQVDEGCKDPEQIHSTALSGAIKQQEGVKNQLLKDYENPEDQTAINDGFSHFETAKKLVATLREQVSQSPEATQKTSQPPRPPR